MSIPTCIHLVPITKDCLKCVDLHFGPKPPPAEKAASAYFEELNATYTAADVAELVAAAKFVAEDDDGPNTIWPNDPAYERLRAALAKFGKAP